MAPPSSSSRKSVHKKERKKKHRSEGSKSELKKKRRKEEKEKKEERAPVSNGAAEEDAGGDVGKKRAAAAAAAAAAEEEAPAWDHLNAPRASSGSKVKVIVRPSMPSHDPIAVSFPGGVPDSVLRAEEAARKTTRFADDGSDVPTFAWSRTHPPHKRRGRSVVHGADDTCGYAASARGDGGGRLTQLCVGLYDSKTRTLTVQPVAERGNVFALSQSVLSYASSSKDGTAIGGAAQADMSFAEKRRLLYESFGTAKKQRSLRSQAANVVKVDSVVGGGKAVMGAVERQVRGGGMSQSNVEAMEKVAGKARENKGEGYMRSTMEDTVEAALAEARAAVLPHFDEDAQEPHLVYPLSAIVGTEAWNQILRVVKACAHKGSEWRDSLTNPHAEDWVTEGWTPSLRTLLEGIEDPAGSKLDAERVRAVLLLRHFMAFHLKFEEKRYSRFSGDEKTLSQVFDLPRPVCRRFLKKFTAYFPAMGGKEDGYTSTKTHRDKRLVHMLLLYVTAHGRDMKVPSIGPFCQDIKLDQTEATDLLREAGCTVKRSKAGAMAVSAVLTVPLTFPPPKRGKR